MLFPSRSLSDPYDQLVAAEMLDAADRIRRYLIGFDEASFFEDLRTIDAVCMNLVRIGEGASELSPAAKSAAPHLPRVRMKDMRNRIARSHAGVSVGILWRTASRNVPELGAHLRERFGPAS